MYVKHDNCTFPHKYIRTHVIKVRITVHHIHVYKCILSITVIKST